MTVPGIGPIISSAMVAAIGSGAAFARGRDFSAWIGLVPKQMSTGDRTILGRMRPVHTDGPQAWTKSIRASTQSKALPRP